MSPPQPSHFTPSQPLHLAVVSHSPHPSLPCSVRSCATIDAAPRLAWTVEHGWGYLLTDEGAGRFPLERDVDAATLPRGTLPVALRRGEVDLVVAHCVQPTATNAPLTMAWVLDVDVTSCDGHVPSIVQRYEEAVLEVSTLRCLLTCTHLPSLALPFHLRPLPLSHTPSRTPTLPHPPSPSLTPFPLVLSACPFVGHDHKRRVARRGHAAAAATRALSLPPSGVWRC